MSDVSVLSQEYHTAAELSDALNRALIVLKKKVLGLAGAASIPAEEVEQSRASLASILGALTTLLASGTRPTALEGTRTGARGSTVAGTGANPALRSAPAALEQVPGAVVGRLRSVHGGDLPYFLEDLQRIADRLRQSRAAGDVTPEDLVILEEVASAAEAEASTVYRRLMRT